MKPKLLRIQGAAPLEIWNMPVQGRTYVIGHDANAGGGSDESDAAVSIVLDAFTLEQVAMLKSRKLQPEDQAEKLYLLSRFYGMNEGDTLTVVENLGHGEWVIKEALKLGHTKIYGDRVGDPQAQTKQFKFKYGFSPTKQSRISLFNHARECFREHYSEEVLAERGPILRSISTLAEMQSLEYDDSGRIDHPKGMHDDEVVAWALALYGAPAARRRKTRPKEKTPERTEEYLNSQRRDQQVEAAMRRLGRGDYKRTQRLLRELDHA